MEQNINSESKTFFTDKEFTTIIDETRQGWDPKSVDAIKSKTITPEQLEKLFDMDLQTSHTLKVMNHMNVKDPVEVYKNHVKAKAKAEEELQKGKAKGNPKAIQNQAEKLGRNIQNAAKGLNID